MFPSINYDLAKRVSELMINDLHCLFYSIGLNILLIMICLICFSLFCFDILFLFLLFSVVLITFNSLGTTVL